MFLRNFLGNKYFSSWIPTGRKRWFNGILARFGLGHLEKFWPVFLVKINQNQFSRPKTSFFLPKLGFSAKNQFSPVKIDQNQFCGQNPFFLAKINKNQPFRSKLTKTSFFGQNPVFLAKIDQNQFFCQNRPKPVFSAKTQLFRPKSTKTGGFRSKSTKTRC